MKAFSIQQPWATLICSGVKDVENRSWALKTTPVRVLIHAGARRRPIDEDNMPYLWLLPVENAQIMGILPALADTPTSAIVGVATIESCVQDSDSIWVQEGHGAEYKWVMRDVKLFKNPIEGVNGKLRLFDVPEITEDNLPECVEVPPITREGTHLTIPLNRIEFEDLRSANADMFCLNLTGENQHLFVTDTYEEKETETVTIVCDGESFEADVVQYFVEKMRYDDTNEIVTYDDVKGLEHEWRRIFIAIRLR